MNNIMKKKYFKNIKNAKSTVSNDAPMLHCNNYLRISRLRDDAHHYLDLIKRNMQLLVNMNMTMRTLGHVDSFKRQKSEFRSKFSEKLNRTIQLQKENFEFGRRLTDIRRACSPSKIIANTMEYDLKRRLRSKKNTKIASFTVPYEILNKYPSPIRYPPNLVQAKKYFRPLVFFDLEIYKVRPLGRIVIELYTEAAPQIVLELINICRDQIAERITILRLFPDLWMEGEFVLVDKSITCGNIEYDMRALDNGKHRGILSFSVCGLKSGVIRYAISFKPLVVLNGKRVAFGRIKRGFEIMTCLKDFGTKNGKPTRRIVVSYCGLLL